MNILFRKFTVAALFALGLASSMVSCSDFFDVKSTYVIDADENHLANATDTVYSVTGILNKLQAIADRTVLLGEARGDLVNVTDATSSDLRDVATFNIGDDNMYNKPSDYYAIINNCNYFIAKADTAMRNNRKENIFQKEYAAVKAIRAWTYLQLAINYGSVPFYTEPILSDEDASKSYPRYDIQQICNYFLDEDGLQAMQNFDYPGYGDIKSLPSQTFFIPIKVILGDLSLWAGRYTDAATYYHDYLTNRLGRFSLNPIGYYSTEWSNSEWIRNTNARFNNSWLHSIEMESSPNSLSQDLITMIPMDSIPSEGNYSQLRNIFNSLSSNDYEVSLVPSQSIIDLSAKQDYCFNNAGDLIYAPKSLDDNEAGDLRLSSCWMQTDNAVLKSTNEKISYQQIYKFSSRNVHIYRRTLIYLRLAEAMNRAGYPRYAYQILSSGINTEIIQDSIAPYLKNPGDTINKDSIYLVENFNFRGNSLSSSSSNYVVYTDPKEYWQKGGNTIGIHSRGSGFTPGNIYYRMPEGTLEEQQKAVEDMIMDEEALEFAFEGYRYYDLLRVALRRNDPSYLANKINNRCSGGATGIKVDLNDKSNWFLKWKGQIGY